MDNQLQVAIQALQEIYNGCSVTGRWIDQLTLDAIGGSDSPCNVPTGYFDWDNEPQEDDADELPPYPESVAAAERDELRLIGGQWLSPARWEEYTEEEQNEQIVACGQAAKAALQALGVPVSAEA